MINNPMKLLALSLSLNLAAMQKETVNVYVTKELEQEAKQQTQDIKRGDLITVLKKQHPEWFNNKQYEVRFVTTLRGTCFEVYRKSAQELEIEESIIDTYKK